MPFFLGSILPYLAAAVFLLGMAWRTWDWLRRPVPSPLTISSATDRTRAVLGELAFFSSLRRGDRRLWISAWLMHLSLAIILAGHLVGIALAGEQFRYFGASAESSLRLSGALGVVAGLAFVAALLALFYRRAATVEIKRISHLEDYFAIVLLLVVAGTGMAMRAAPTEIELAAIRGYMGGLLSLRPRPLPASGLFAVHFTAVNLLLLYFPFSKLVHLTGGIIAKSLVLQPAPVYPSKSLQPEGQSP